MGIAPLNSPPANVAQLEKELQAWTETNQPEGLSKSSYATVTQGIPVYELSSEEAGLQQLLLAASHTRDRHLLLGAGVACFADLAIDETASERLLEVVCGEAAAELTDALRSAEQFAGGAEYEARILEVPSCDMSALWLAGPTDKFIPLLGDSRHSPTEDKAFLDHIAEVAALRRDNPNIWDDLEDG